MPCKNWLGMAKGLMVCCMDIANPNHRPLPYIDKMEHSYMAIYAMIMW